MTRDAGQQLVGKQGISQQVGTTLEESEMGMLSTGVGSATCVQHSIGSRNSAVRSAYRTSLRPSSSFEPRHPSLEVVRLGKIILYMRISCSRSYMSTRSKVWRRLDATQRNTVRVYEPCLTHLRARSVWMLLVMILPQVHLRKPCYDFSFL